MGKPNISMRVCVCEWGGLYLDDEEEGRGGVEGSIVEGDDGGAMSPKQVSYLTGSQGTHTQARRYWSLVHVSDHPGVCVLYTFLGITWPGCVEHVCVCVCVCPGDDHL